MKTCECGCGQPAPIARQSRTKEGYVKGQPLRFVLGHSTKGRPKTPEHRAKIAAALTGNTNGVGEKNGNWNGGRHVRPDGYVDVLARAHPNASRNRVLEHRLVMEQRIGRLLKRQEVVHHVDENPSNNEPSNLWLWPTQAAHKAWHAMLEQGHDLRVSMSAVEVHRANA